MEAAAAVFAGVFVLVTVGVLGDTRGVLDQWLIDAIQRIDSGALRALFRPVDTLTGPDGAIAMWLALFAVFAILRLWLPALTAATPDATATVRFGRPDTGSPFPPHLLINDADDLLLLGPLNAPPATTTWTSPAGTFDQPGRYLVICNITPHFALLNMYGWVIVQ